tara:strand:- start:57 stop:284 length:228 start_codon:yes stop_codon:yes gene_type:complete
MFSGMNWSLSMCPGDLVKRKPVWGAWVKYNPWMIDEKDGEIGMVLRIAKIGRASDVKVLWPSGMTWVDKDSLDLA